jgi:uncharacterized repeat protein (TIGR03803 family)
VLHHFAGSPDDGQLPYAGLIQGSDGVLYGTTQQGGSGGYGTVFKLGTSGGSFSILYNFDFAVGSGYSPWAGLLQGSDAAFYGTVPSGPSSQGAVFRLTAAGSYTVLHTFGSAPGDGQMPYGALIQASDGALYGTTSAGGSASLGTVYKLNLDGSDYAVVYSFGPIPGDGQQPKAALMQGSDGALFGTTQLGGDVAVGTVFRLHPPPTFTNISRGSGQAVQLTLNGFPQVTYSLKMSADGSVWVNLANLTSAGGVFHFTDSTAAGANQRFYRAVWP